MGAFKTEFILKGQGINLTTWKLRALEVKDFASKEWSYKERFQGDENLLEAAINVIDTYKKGKIVEGVIGSGYTWNKEIDRILWLNETLGTSAEEMEAAAVAQIAKCYGIPCLSIRILSNNEVHMEEFDPTTGDECQVFALNVIKSYIPTKGTWGNIR